MVDREYWWTGCNGDSNQSNSLYLELLLEARGALSWQHLVHLVHPGPQVGGSNICLPTGDQLIQSIMDEDILGL